MERTLWRAGEEKKERKMKLRLNGQKGKASKKKVVSFFFVVFFPFFFLGGGGGRTRER